MKILYTKKFLRSFNKLLSDIKKRAKKKFNIFLNNSNHPSLRVKKIKNRKGVFEGRINRDYRFSFLITKEAYVFINIGKHDEVLN